MKIKVAYLERLKEEDWAAHFPEQVPKRPTEDLPKLKSSFSTNGRLISLSVLSIQLELDNSTEAQHAQGKT